MNLPSALLAALGIVLAGSLLWRFASRRQTLPCPVWLRWMVELDNPLTRTNRAAFIVQALDVAAGMQLLDAGCGPGRLTLPLARAAGPSGGVLAVDLQAGMIARAAAKTQAAGLVNIEWRQAALGQGNLPHGRFDRAVLVTVLGEIPDRGAAMRELFAALKPGGRLSVTEVIFDPHFQRRSEVLRLAHEAGFRIGAFFGNRIAYVQHLEKPRGKAESPSTDG